MLRIQSPAEGWIVPITWEIIAYHQKFITSYISILRNNLHPQSSYQVVLASLKSLEILQQSGIDPQSEGQKRRSLLYGNSISWPFSISIFTKQLLRCLFDLLWSPFDDIRTLTSAILQEFNPNIFSALKDSGTFDDTMSSLVHRSEVKAEYTGRSDHADGQARVYELQLIYESRCLRSNPNIFLLSRLGQVLDRLEKKLFVTEEDLCKAISSRPIHGELIGIRFVNSIKKHRKLTTWKLSTKSSL